MLWYVTHYHNSSKNILTQKAIIKVIRGVYHQLWILSPKIFRHIKLSTPHSNPAIIMNNEKNLILIMSIKHALEKYQIKQEIPNCIAFLYYRCVTWTEHNFGSILIAYAVSINLLKRHIGCYIVSPLLLRNFLFDIPTGVCLEFYFPAIIDKKFGWLTVSTCTHVW